MDHLDAAQMKAAERYVLGDLSVSEVEEFERHFFDCPQCSEELRALTIFQENARAVFIEQDLAPIPARLPVPESAATWWRGFSPLSFFQGGQWAVALGALLIGIFGGYEAFGAREFAQIATYPVHAEARGGEKEPVIIPSSGSTADVLYLDRGWDSNFPSYSAIVRDISNGVDKFTVPVTVSNEPNKPIYVVLPSNKLRKLAAGEYVAVMQGIDEAGKPTDLTRYPFKVQFK